MLLSHSCTDSCCSTCSRARTLDRNRYALSITNKFPERHPSMPVFGRDDAVLFLRVI